MAGENQKYPIPGKPYGGWTPPKPAVFHQRMGYALGVTMWLWVFYRAKQDLPHMLGFEHPWDHHHGGDHDHDSAPAH